FLADSIGRKPTAMLFYFMCLVLTPLVYLWGQSQDIGVVLFLVGVFGFFTLGIWAWAPVWLPELFPTRMRGTAVAFCFNAPSSKMATGRRPGALFSKGTTSLSQTMASGSRRRRPRGAFFCDGS